MKLSYLKNLLPIILIPLIHACGGGSSGGAETDASLSVTVVVPSGIATASLPSGTIRVFVNKTGDAPVEMTLNGSTATYTFTSLAASVSSVAQSYEVTISFDAAMYTNTVTLATGSSAITLSSGDNSLVFPDTLLDLSIDTDSDARANLDELVAGTNPFIPLCVLGDSGAAGQLGGCELGS